MRSVIGKSLIKKNIGVGGRIRGDSNLSNLKQMLKGMELKETMPKKVKPKHKKISI